MTFALQIVIGIFLLGILVLVHELGHFAAAKKFGIRVITFSIGFGKPLFSKTVGDTEYRISAIPFGGFVHMAGEHADDEHEGKENEFTSKPVWQRAIVAVAGPLANVIVAILLLWLLFILGTRTQLQIKAPLIGTVEKESPAFVAGLEPGDSIVAINATAIHSWEQIKNIFSLRGKSYSVAFFRKGVKKEAHIIMGSEKSNELPKFPFAGLEPVFPPHIGEISKGSPAEKFGLQPNDKILAIDNISITTWLQIPQIVSGYDSLFGKMQVVLQRSDSIIIITVVPAFSEEHKRFLLGIGPQTETVKYSAVQAIPKAFEKSWEFTFMIFDILKKLAQRDVSPKHLAGPIGIIQMSGAAAMGSLQFLLNFLALIGINLAVINLFPLIITDGGVLLFLIIEGVRKKPLTLKTQLLLNRIAIAFFIMLFVFVTFNDITRIPIMFRMFAK